MTLLCCARKSSSTAHPRGGVVSIAALTGRDAGNTDFVAGIASCGPCSPLHDSIPAERT